MVPVTVIASNRPTDETFRDLPSDVTVIAARSFALLPLPIEMITDGRFVASEPAVFERTAGCRCCAVREDLVDSLVRATRRRRPPERIAVLVDLRHDDVLTAIATILSTAEIRDRCQLDDVVVDADAVELATRLSAHGGLADDGLNAAIAIADRIVVARSGKATAAARRTIRDTLAARAGFVQIVEADTPLIRGDTYLDAWHGAPSARPIAAGRPDDPATIVLRVDDPLDADAIDDWLDLLIRRHATGLLRLQGALSVLGEDDRICCFGIRSFACSHSEREHPDRRSNRSELAICGVGLDAEELTASFRATVAS